MDLYNKYFIRLGGARVIVISANVYVISKTAMFAFNEQQLDILYW